MRAFAPLLVALAFALTAPAYAQPAGPASGAHAAAMPLDQAKASTPKTNVTTDVTDIWWSSVESGWGIQLVHNNDLLFATLFVYGAGGAPTFFVAVLDNTPSGSGTWTGTLYSTTGTPLGSPWNPASVTETPVGTMTFVLTGIGTGTLTYNVGLTNVSKSIERQTLKLENNSGDYLLTDTFGSANPGCPTGVETGTLNIAQTGATATLKINWDGTLCTFPTTYSQFGRFGQYQGTMSCANGTTGTAIFFEVHNRVKIVTGRYVITNNAGCTYQGRFAAIAPTP